MFWLIPQKSHRTPSTFLQLHFRLMYDEQELDVLQKMTQKTKNENMEIVRTEKEINQLLNECAEAEDMGTTKFPGMTYEQGIKEAIEWLSGDSNCYPLAD